jgi:hypothetical protein
MSLLKTQSEAAFKERQEKKEAALLADLDDYWAKKPEEAEKPAEEEAKAEEAPATEVEEPAAVAKETIKEE